MTDSKFHIGCSSFRESRWKGIFYPEDLPGKDYFKFYSQHFNTYEMNGTFYKFPTLKVMQNWYDRSPENYMFSVKVNKVITHFKRFKDCKTELDQFYDVCSQGLKEKLSCVLFQLPPSFKYDPEKLQLIIDSLNPQFKNVVEFRHESWWNDDVFEAFSKKNITFCNVSYPKLPTEIIKTTSIGYFRFHGVPKLFYSEYSDLELKNVKSGLSKKSFSEVFVYFNNTASTAGIVNATKFKDDNLG